MRDLPEHTVLRLVGANVALAGVYALVGTLSLLVGQFTGLAAPVWPAAGIALAVVYQRGRALLPGVLLGSFLVNLPALVRGDGTAFWTAVAVVSAIACGAALQAFAGGALLRRVFGLRPSLSRGGQVLLFLVLAGPVACMVNPTVGVSAQLLGGVISAEQVALGWLTWWIGDSIGVIVFAPITLMLLPEQSDVWRGRRWKVALPSLIAVTMFAALFLQSSGQESRRTEEEVRRLAVAAGNDLTQSALQHQEVLEGMRSFFNASQNVTVEEFRAFTKPALARYPNLEALAWDAVVTHEDVVEFERRQRIEQGVADFTVTERDEQGELQPVVGGSDSDAHVVVTFIEPLNQNRSALGFDVQSDPTRVATIDGARDSGEARATPPIQLVQGAQNGMLAMLPVYEGGRTPDELEQRRSLLIGYAVGVYRLGDLLADTFRSSDWDDVQLDLVDVTEGGDALIAQRPAVNAAVVDPAVPEARRAASDPIQIYGRTWELVAIPTSGPLAATARPMATSFLMSGLLVIGLLEAFLLLLTGLERQARREADTSSYEAQHDPLTGLLNRRAFLEQLELLRNRAVEEGSAHALMYLDLDGMKAVNDRGGHEAGDTLLIEAADVFRSKVRSRDIVARVGGDEFAIILGNCPAQMALDIAGEIIDAIGLLEIHAGRTALSVGVSIGITLIQGHDAAYVNELVRRADTACYDAKRAGKGQVRTYERLPSTLENGR